MIWINLQDLIAAAPAIICDGGLPADVLIALRERLPEEAFFYCNPGSVALAPRLEPLLDRLDLITCNHLEAQALTQVKVDGPAKLISAALILVKQGVKRAVVTFGARGLAYADEERSLYQPARPVNLVDATGAGDALAAALIEALLRDEPIGVCLQRGLAAAALTCESEDTVAPTMSLSAIQQRILTTKNTKEHEGETYMKTQETTDLLFKDEVYAIFGAAIEVHKELGLVFWRPSIRKRWRLNCASEAFPLNRRSLCPFSTRDAC